MGCRVSIQFTERLYNKDKGKHETNKSSVLYHHWAGNELPKAVKKFLNGMYKKDLKGAYRTGVQSLLFEFIQYCFQNKMFDVNSNNSASIWDKNDIEGSDDTGHYTFQVSQDYYQVRHKRGRWQNERLLKTGKVSKFSVEDVRPPESQL